MTRDIETLRRWLFIVVLIAGVGATSVPLIYSFTGWRKLRIGRLFMYKSLSFAVLVDTFVLFRFWKPDVLVVFWIYVSVFTIIAFFTTAMTLSVIRMNYLGRKERRREIE